MTKKTAAPVDELAKARLARAFPECDPGVIPFGSRVMVQIRSVKNKSAGGIILPSDTQETEQHNTQTAKVAALGPLAFHNRNTLELWPEGAWCQVGEYVRVPRFGGDRWQVKLDNEDKDTVEFVIFNDLDVVGKVTGDPLSVRAFL